MTAKDFAKMKHVEFKKHLAIARSGVDGSTPLACRRGLLPKTMGSGRSQTKVDRSKCKTGAEMRRGRPARPPSDTFEWCGVKFKVKRPPVEAVPEAAPREPRPGTAARKAAADITASVVDDLGGSAAPAPAPLTPWEESLVGDAFKAPEGSRFKDRDLLAGVDVYAQRGVLAQELGMAWRRLRYERTLAKIPVFADIGAYGSVFSEVRIHRTGLDGSRRHWSGNTATREWASPCSERFQRCRGV